MAEILSNIIMSDEVIILGQYPSAPAALETLIEKTNIDEDSLQLLKNQAREEGFKQGYEDGQKKAEMHSEKQINEQCAGIQELLRTLPQAIADNRQQLEQEVADIVLAITQQFFIHQQHDKESIVQIVSQAINQLNDKQNIEIALHPGDLALLKQGQVKIDFSQFKNLRIVPDDSLKLGGCIIRSEHGLFDVSIERQIERLKHALLQIKNGERS